jgi:hypothetical protein
MKEERFNIAKTSYPKSQYTKVIDNSFTQLVTIPEVPPAPPTVDAFFELYNELFFDIPKEGEINSHTFLIEQSSEYLGKDPLSEEFGALLEEVNSLRQQLLEANQEILELRTQAASSAVNIEELETTLSNL